MSFVWSNLLGLNKLSHLLFKLLLYPFRETLAFATEPVFSCLANVLNKHDNMPTPLPADFKDYKLYEVEIKHGLLQVS